MWIQIAIQQNKSVCTDSELLVQRLRYPPLLEPPIVALPDTQAHDISNENCLFKVLRGISASVGGLWNGFTSWLSGAAKTVGSAIDTFRKDPVGTLRGIGSAIISGTKTVGSAAVWAVTHPIETNIMVGSALINGIKSYADALQKDLVGTLAKTAIVAGGAILVASGIGAPAGAALFGAGLSFVGAATLMAQDAYEYATARTEEELLVRAKENQDDLIWAAGGFLATVQGFKAAQIAKVMKFNGEIINKDWVVTKLPNGRFVGNPAGVRTSDIVLVKARNWDEIPYFYRKHILMHERIEAAKIRRAINIDKDKIEQLIRSYGLDYSVFDEMLLPDVAASYFTSKNGMIATRMAWGEPNWWERYPELVKLAKDQIPLSWKLYKPSKYTIGSLTGIELSIVTRNEIYEQSR
ncbi:MAG: hypothetical protein QW761_01320 [Candidatus Aenigmatarchaeota archaeon]